MCRLFGMHAGHRSVHATFWLLTAPDSLEVQSRREPDGTGVGTFTADGLPRVDKQPIAAWEDRAFAREARDLVSSTFLAHVRYASIGEHTYANTHPFEQDGRLFAHNGAFTEVAAVDQRLDELGAADLVQGQTDSERMFALITSETRRADGDVAAGIEAALTWIAQNVPVLSLNFILTTATDLWAVRYPDTHELHVLDNRTGAAAPGRHLRARSPRISAHGEDIGDFVLVATEPMANDLRWHLMDPGVLLHVDRDLTVTRTSPFPDEPTRRLTLDDLDPVAAASQREGKP
ncbi:class II glutamine amidotransferase [Sinomonas cyclohexanicum]|uniref:Class II glutamine amidotransferase n=1 Tax=Sinomonas cyclohexanicum TaxID=322009 RepID=A0ABM7PYJ7_SINCY|nr:class II glutamine amidotransferase [Corynebacterium cyclohexanicum]BCT77374.1 class II glutamine amidotransferase [Corynebacterium cyclohexanicum]